MDAGEKIKALRRYKGWTQEKLGKKAGVHQNSIGRYEAGKSEPTVEIYEALLNAMGFQLEIREMRK